MSTYKVPNALEVLRVKERCSRSQRSFPSNFNRDAIRDSDKWGGGRKGAREDEGDNNEITQSLRFLTCTSLWLCWSIMFAMGGGMTKGEESGQRAQQWGKRKKNTFFVQFDLTSDASLLG